MDQLLIEQYTKTVMTVNIGTQILLYFIFSLKTNHLSKNLF